MVFFIISIHFYAYEKQGFHIYLQNFWLKLSFDTVKNFYVEKRKFSYYADNW